MPLTLTKQKSIETMSSSKEVNIILIGQLIGYAIVGVGMYIHHDDTEFSDISSNPAQEEQHVNDYNKIMKNLASLKAEFRDAIEDHQANNLLLGLEGENVGSSIPEHVASNPDYISFQEKNARFLDLLAFDKTVSEQEKDDLIATAWNRDLIGKDMIDAPRDMIDAQYLDECSLTEKTAADVFQCTAENNQRHKDETEVLSNTVIGLGFAVNILSLVLSGPIVRRRKPTSSAKYKH